jgi:UPF0755 protein
VRVRILVALGGAGALVLAVVLAWCALVFVDRSKPPARTQVIVSQGATFNEVTDQLARSGVIDNVPAFRVLARLTHEEDEVRSGGYTFAPHQTASEVLHSLVTGGAQTEAWVTIPEGFTTAQIAERLAHEGVGQAPLYERAFRSTPLEVDGVRVPSLEGYLFPNTYLVPFGSSPQEIAAQMTSEFFKELPPNAASLAKQLHVTVPQAVTVASLVEREAKVEADRPMIAGVIYNRLRIGMPLQVDAAIEYALPHHKAELSAADLKIDSPYNTYLHPGLPPTPIANPGKASIEAALHPAKTSDLYYVYCGRGRHVFARTLAEHQANIARCLH